MPFSAPRLLVVATEANSTTDALLQALSEVGFVLALVYGRGNPPRRHRNLAAAIPAASWQFRQAAEDAIHSLAPDMIIPADKTALRHLFTLYEINARRDDPASLAVRRLMEGSLGQAFSYRLSANHAALATLSRDQKLPTPSSVEVTDEVTLRTLLPSVPMPVTMRASDLWNERGAALVRDRNGGVAAYRRMTGARALVQEFLASGETRQWPGASRRHVLVQQFIDGVPASRAAICRHGKVLAGIDVELREGRVPGTLAFTRFIDHPTMRRVAGALADSLSLSGFIQFDFTLEQRSGNAFLTGMARYATPLSPLVTSEADLVGALFRSFGGTAPSRRDALAENVIALFARARAHKPEPDQTDRGNADEYRAPLRDYIMSPDAVAAKTGNADTRANRDWKR